MRHYASDSTVVVQNASRQQSGRLAAKGDVNHPHTMNLPDNPDARAVSFTMKKGGCGTTLLAKNVAERMAQAYDVLFLDVDPEGNATESLMPGYRNETEDDEDVVHLGHVLTGNADPEDAIYEHEWGFDFVPAHRDFEALENKITTSDFGVLWLKQEIVDPFLGDEYDFIIFDSGGTGRLANSSIVAAQNVVLPLLMDELNVNGLRNTIETQIQKVRNQGLDVDILAIVPNKLDEPQRVQKEGSQNYYLNQLTSSKFGQFVPEFGQPSEWERPGPGPGIRKRNDLHYAYRAGEPLAQFAPNNDMLPRIEKLAEIVARGGVTQMDSSETTAVVAED